MSLSLWYNYQGQITQDMANAGPLFRSETEWMCALKDHCRGAFDETCWQE